MNKNDHIQWCRYGYYLVIYAVYDVYIARVLGIEFKRYREILESHGETFIANSSYFSSRVSCENCLRELEPYIIMAKLEKKINI